ncbi:MAG: flippase [Candidatus Gracilibacteria bacterium]
MTSTFRTIVFNSFFRAIIEGVKAVSGIALVVLLARLFGPEEYGRFSFALALTGFASIVMNLGLPTTFVRDGARDEKFLRENLITALFMQGIASFLIFLALVGAILIFPVLRQDALLLMIALFYTMFSIITNFLYSAFQAVNRMHLEAIAIATQYGFLIIFVLFFLFKKGTIEEVMFGYLGASVLGGMITLILIRKYLFSWIWQINWKMGRILFSQSWPLMAGSALSTVYFSLDSIMLRFFKDSEAVGIYSAMYKIVFAFWLLASLYGYSIAPVFSKLFAHAREEFMSVYKRSVQLMAGLGFFFGLGITFFARPIVELCFGEAYLVGTLTLQIMIWSIMVFLVGGILYGALIVVGKQKDLLWSVLLSTLLNFIFNMILIPSWGGEGAATATVIAQIAQLLFNIYFLRGIIPIKFFPMIAKPTFMALGSVALFFTLSLVLPPVLAASFAMATYVALIFIGKIIHPQEIRQMVKVLMRRE